MDMTPMNNDEVLLMSIIFSVDYDKHKYQKKFPTQTCLWSFEPDVAIRQTYCHKLK